MRVVVGRVGRPHGIRGEVTVEPRTDEPDLRFCEGAELLRADGGRPLVVEYAHWHSGRLLIAFDGVDDRNGAEALRGVILEVDRDSADMPEDADEFYDTALVGCRVETIDGESVGEVREVAHLPAQDLLVVMSDDSAEILVPFVAEIVPVVDIKGRRIVIAPPPGLIADIEA